MSSATDHFNTDFTTTCKKTTTLFGWTCDVMAVYIESAFVWGRSPDVSSGRFSFHVQYIDTNIWEFYFYCPFSFNILLFKENLSELQACLRNPGNGVSEWSILKISLEACPQNPLGACAFRARNASYGAKTQNHVRYLTKLVKTLNYFCSCLVFITCFDFLSRHLLVGHVYLAKPPANISSGRHFDK